MVISIVGVGKSVTLIYIYIYHIQIINVFAYPFNYLTQLVNSCRFIMSLFCSTCIQMRFTLACWGRVIVLVFLVLQEHLMAYYYSYHMLLGPPNLTTVFH
jgi:hypothetical protein